MGDVLPGRFIAIAEKEGLIRDLTRMVLRKVCEDVSGYPDLVVSVNVSPLDVIDPVFPGEVASILDEFGVRPTQIILESTDKMSSEDSKKAAPNVEKLRDQGHSVAVYEMEGGFESFGFLKMPGYTLLKIDKELLDEALNDPKSREDLQEAITMSKTKGFKTLAIGVENEAQAEFVDQLGFDLQQGFLHSGSLSLNELLDFSGLGSEGSA